MRKLLAVLLATALLIPAACGCAEEVRASFEDVGMGNPWQETTPEDLSRVYGYEFAVPGDAVDVAWFINDKLQMAEMQFSINSVMMTARVAAVDPEDISGTNYDHWDAEEHCLVGNWEGVTRRVNDEDRTIDVCLWYDADKGLTYSLVAEGEDLDGFDVTAVAEQVYVSGETTDASENDSERESEAIGDAWDTDGTDGFDTSEEAEYPEDMAAFDEDEVYGEADESEAYEPQEEDGDIDEPEADEEPEAVDTYYEEPAGEETEE